MATTGTERKLAAVFVTDVVGYSRLMGDDHEATVHTLGAYRQVFSDYIQQYKGRVVNAPGDSILARFENEAKWLTAAPLRHHTSKNESKSFSAQKSGGTTGVRWISL